jgi:competence CoiA-like predicted nuclease
MTLYALNFEGIISAAEAENKGQYRCLECNLSLQLRQGKRQKHFYHTKRSPQCRLYSKSEAHLLLQLQIQALFPKGEIFLERPFPQISRLADACWERHKIIFEIQCSLLPLEEAQARVQDYSSLGYIVIWLLDDRMFNRSILRPAESFFRMQICYYIHYQKASSSLFYDQFDLIQKKKKRLKKSSRLVVQLTEPRQMPKASIPMQSLAQITQRSLSHPLFFHGDLVHKALLSKKDRSIAFAMKNWHFLERDLPDKQNFSLATDWSKKYFLHPFWRFFEWLLQKIDA